jgi:hypothetical protein
MLSQREFDLVLCQYDLPDRTAFPLVDWLEGSSSTLVVSARSRSGSRWLPVVERGERCLDRPLLQMRDLPNALGKVLDGCVKAAKGDLVVARDLEHVGPR